MDCAKSPIVDRKKRYHKEFSEVFDRVGNLHKRHLQDIIEPDHNVFRPVKKHDIKGVPPPKKHSPERYQVGRHKRNQRYICQIFSLYLQLMSLSINCNSIYTQILMPFLKSEYKSAHGGLSFRPKARILRAEVEESISIVSPKANQKVEIIYWKRHYPISQIHRSR